MFLSESQNAALSWLRSIWDSAVTNPADYIELDEESGKVRVQFPHDEDFYHFSPEELESMVERVRRLDAKETTGVVIVSDATYQLLVTANERAEFFVQHGYEVQVAAAPGITLGYSDHYFPIALAAFTLGAVEDFWPPSAYKGIEILYHEGVARLPLPEEQQLFDSFLFELTADHDILFRRGQFETNFDLPEDPLGEGDSAADLVIRPLENFNEGSRLFLAAMQVTDPELRFLSLYKVLEYFAPVVYSLEENDAVRRKLDSPACLAPDGRYIRTMIELVRSYDRRRSDRESMKALLATCIDILELGRFLPTVRQPNVSYESRRGDVDSYIKSIADSVVATRNQVAHAKSNYEPQGNEFQSGELSEVNEFLRHAAAQTVRWYNHLPEHQRAAH